MARRYAKWFTISPSGTTSGPANATYNGVDTFGNRDPIGQGTVGWTYSVIMYSGSKLEAPNPPFSTGEGFSIPTKYVSNAIERTLSRKKPIPPRSPSARKAARRK